jgi:hypothetical protein
MLTAPELRWVGSQNVPSRTCSSSLLPGIVELGPDLDHQHGASTGVQPVA